MGASCLARDIVARAFRRGSVRRESFASTRQSFVVSRFVSSSTDKPLSRCCGLETYGQRPLLVELPGGPLTQPATLWHYGC